MTTVSRKEQLEQRIAALSSVYGKRIKDIDATEAQLDIHFLNGWHLTIALTDTCPGSRTMTWDSFEEGETVRDIAFVYYRGHVRLGHPRRDIIQLKILTDKDFRTINFHNIHSSTCQSFELRYKLTLCGTNWEHEGAF